MLPTSSLAIEILAAIGLLYIAGAIFVGLVFAFHFSRRRALKITDYETFVGASAAAVIWPALLYALIVDFANQY